MIGNDVTESVYFNVAMGWQAPIHRSPVVSLRPNIYYIIYKSNLPKLESHGRASRQGPDQNKLNRLGIKNIDFYQLLFIPWKNIFPCRNYWSNFSNDVKLYCASDFQSRVLKLSGYVLRIS